jgi:hypothetical protein
LTRVGGQFQVCGDSTHIDVAIASSELLVPKFIACDSMG